MPRFAFVLKAALLAVWALFAAASAAEALPLRVATFSCDATPPLGEPMVWANRLNKVEAPLLAKGIVLEAGARRYVICAIDWCLVGNQSYQRFCAALADAAGTSPDRVAFQSLHQHAAPSSDEGAFPLLESASQPLPHLSTNYLAALRANLKSAVTRAVTRLENFDQVGVSEVRVDRIASARRLKSPEGRILTRFSASAKDPAMAEAPEGAVDPMLKTITLARGGNAIVRLHYYATHPQTFCCDGRASCDFVGLAREAVEREEKVFQIYFTGCSGDITVGKYNDGSVRALNELTARLHGAMRSAAAATQFTLATNLTWRTEAFSLPLRGVTKVVREESEAWLADPAREQSSRVYKGAMRLSYLARDWPIPVSSLQIGQVHILHLPGEPMVEFQRFAQRSAPQDFVAVAGYGDCGPAYICTDEAIQEGGYEPSASNVGTGSEARLKEAILHLLGSPVRPEKP